MPRFFCLDHIICIYKTTGLEIQSEVYRVDAADSFASGIEFTRATFLGTYIDKQVAISMARKLANDDGPVVSIIRLKKGFRGIYIPAILPHGNNLGESKFLLPRNLHLKKTSSFKSDGVRFHVIEVIN